MGKAGQTRAIYAYSKPALHASPQEFWLGGSDMSFQVVRHEHPNILVVNRQTYETYRFTVGEDGAPRQDGLRSDLREAHRTAMAFLARRERARAPR